MSPPSCPADRRNRRLNYALALIGSSGSGKGAATSAVRETARFRVGQMVERAAARPPVGSGEGMTKAFGQMEKIGNEPASSYPSTVGR